MIQLWLKRSLLYTKYLAFTVKFVIYTNFIYRIYFVWKMHDFTWKSGFSKNVETFEKSSFHKISIFALNMHEFIPGFSENAKSTFYWSIRPWLLNLFYTLSLHKIAWFFFQAFLITLRLFRIEIISNYEKSTFY